jgi:hypothetical protein
MQKWLDRSQTPTQRGNVNISFDDPNQMFGKDQGAGGVGGYVLPDQPGTIYMKRGMSGEQQKNLLFHELGHQFDTGTMQDPERQWFQRDILGSVGAAPGAGQGTEVVGGLGDRREQLAEWLRGAAMWDPSNPGSGGIPVYGMRWGPKRMAKLQRFLRRTYGG